MDSGYWGLITTIVGAILGAVLNEQYKRHRDAAATAAALAGELSSYREAFKQLDLSLPILIDRVHQGQALNMPEQSPPTDIAYEKYVDKVGLLGSQLAEEIAFVYGQIRAFRSAFFPLTRRGESFDPAYVEAALRMAHAFAQIANQRGEPLVKTLQKRAVRSFWRFWA